MIVEMKDSGIAWIGEIPKHWNISKVSNHYNVQLGKMLQPKKELSDDKLEYYLCAANVSKNQLHLDSIKQMWMKQCELDLYSLKKGDLLVVEGGDVASCAILKEDISNLYFQNALHRVRPIGKNDNRYLRYILLVAKDSGHIDLVCNKATISHFTKDKFEKLVFLNVPVVEQSLIANFLDKKCAEIDELIALQEQMIAQLTTYKQAVITETVTKGLDPNVKMKDSGVEWIGEIPEHWGNAKIKNFIALVESGVSVNAGGNSAGENEYGVLKTSSVSKYVFDITENKTVFPEEIERLKCPVKANTLIVSRMNTPELVGACGYVEENSYNIYLPDRLWQVHLTSQIHVKFVWYYLRSSFVRAYYSSLSSGTSSSMQNISQDQFANVSIMLPPLSEQQSIAQYLDQKCKEIDELISIKKEKIEHLKAYKKSVIYEYVTGKKHIDR